MHFTPILYIQGKLLNWSDVPENSSLSFKNHFQRFILLKIFFAHEKVV